MRYTFNLVFKDHLGMNFTITDDQAEFHYSNSYRICYATHPIDDVSFFIRSEQLLTENGVKQQNLTVGNWNGIVTLFSNHSNRYFPFDIFSAIFFLVSRYEEYLPHVRDQYNRFEPESSIAFAHGFLDMPVVNHWIDRFAKALQNKFPGIQFRPPAYRYISTIDIDNAYAFKQKGAMRTFGGYLRGLLNLNWKNILDRTNVILGKMPDPFDSYSNQLQLQEEFQLEVIYFILLGDYGINDKNLPSNNTHLQELIKHLSDYAEVGIHPSFGSNENPSQVKKEISRLTRITHKEVKSSRQHFSRLHFPSTYQILLENEVQQDFSMGYHDVSGFRAGISTPFFWYDLESEIETSLKVFPHVFSESCLRYGMKLNPEQAFEHAKALITRVKDTNGTFVSMFNNESMGDYGEWNGWKSLYKQIILEAKSQ